MKQYRCPHCNGRLFDFVQSENRIVLEMHNCQLIIKCWKCHENIVIKYDDLV